MTAHKITVHEEMNKRNDEGISGVGSSYLSNCLYIYLSIRLFL